MQRDKTPPAPPKPRTRPAPARLVDPLLAWYALHARDLPWRKTRDPYPVWVSEIMLQQTQVKTVIPYWNRWMQTLPTLHDLAQANAVLIHKLWEGLGYYTRVRNMQRAAQVIVQQHHGLFPKTLQDILALPGIGRYTAGAICSIAYHQPQPVLDGNVIRVFTRLFGIDGPPREKEVHQQLWQLATDLIHAIPDGDSRCSDLNQAVMEVGALVCLPRQPHCRICPVRDQCNASRTGRVNQLPSRAPRIPTTPQQVVAFIAQNRGRFLVRQRPAGVVNAHLWEFPNADIQHPRADLPREARQALGTIPGSLQPLCVLKHSITRYRITLQAYRVTLKTRPSPSQPGSAWLTRSQLQTLPFTSAHRKILARLI